MKIVLVNPPLNKDLGIKGHGGNMMPLGLCYLASYVRMLYPDVNISILDGQALNLTIDNAVTSILNRGPDLVGITANTCVFDSVIELSQSLKKRNPNLKIVLGGPHPSVLPVESLKNSKADFAVIGEGELTFAELLAAVMDGKNSYASINGLAFWQGVNVIVNTQRELLEDLDILPFPARDLLSTDLYLPPPTKRVELGANTLIATSRGCPYNCGFCGSKILWQRRIRARNPKKVVDEIEYCIKKYRIRSVNFIDDFFTANRKRIHQICHQIVKRNLRISWVCMARAQGLDEDTLLLMKQAGCRKISFGIESGNTEILKKIDKSLCLNEAATVIKRVKRMGIQTHASYILGYLGETNSSIKDTIKYAKKLNTDVAAFFVASPLPGTNFYHEAKKQGYLRAGAKWIDFSPLTNAKPVIELPGLPADQIWKWQRKAIKSYYLAPRYLISRLLKVRNWYEIINLFNGLMLFFRIKKGRL